MKFSDRVKNAWNAFSNTSVDKTISYSSGWESNYPIFRSASKIGNDRSIVTSVYNRIALDVSQIKLEHARVDENGRYMESITSGLNYALTQEANIDQTGKTLILDAVMSMFDEGSVAIVPVDTVGDPILGSYDIKTLRVGKIVGWLPTAVRVELYNERTGNRDQIVLPKSIVAIVQNPFYSVMNSPNSTLQRLIHKLNLLDYIDDQSGSGKLDLIIQLPYSLVSQTRKDKANERKQEIEDQLKDSKFGIAYIDSTEHITQLNRSVNNNLLDQINSLTALLYSQLGLTAEIMNGTANESVMKNYYSRTVNPIIESFKDELQRKFLTKTARSQGQAILYFNDVFSLIPVDSLADIADKFTRNEILTANEIRSVIGFKPSKDPKSDQLRNSNLNQASDSSMPVVDVDGNQIAPAPADAEQAESPTDQTGETADQSSDIITQLIRQGDAIDDS